MKRSSTFLISLVLGILFGGLHLLGVGEYLEEISIDSRLRSKPTQPVSDDVRLIAIGDRDVGSEELGRWPFPRPVHGDILQILQALGAQHVAVDILFTEQSQNIEQDAQLKGVLDEMENLTLAYHFENLQLHPPNPTNISPHFLEGKRYGLAVKKSQFIHGTKPVPPFTEIKSGFGAVNVEPSDVDELVRKVPLFIIHGDRFYPTFAMQTIIQALDADPDQIRIEPGSAVELIGTSRGNLRIPIDQQGQYRVNFTDSSDHFGETFQYLDLYDAVPDEELAKSIGGIISDRVVLIGNTSLGNTDIANTPLGRMSGLAIHAMVVSNILSENHLHRLPRWTESLLILVATVCLATLMRPSRPWLNLALLGLLVCGWLLAGYIGIRSNWILPLTPIAGSSLAVLLFLLPFQFTAIVGNLVPFIPPPLCRVMLENQPLQSSTVRREMTIFFADLRGFTQWTEQKEPDEVASALNEYLTMMTEVVEKHGGTLDKFIGDCVMVFFNAPEERKDHAIATVQMAWEMQRRMEGLVEKWRAAGSAPLSTGIGIHTEWVTVGNFGSVRFQDYTVIGRGVNLAARIESCAPGKTILLSPKTNALVSDSVETRLFAELKLKGIPSPTPVFEVLEVKGAPPVSHSAETAEWFVTENGNQLGPFPKSGIDTMVRCGRISPTDAKHRDDIPTESKS